MNWTNYGRLVNRLETMSARFFDYEKPGDMDCGCVFVQARHAGMSVRWPWRLRHVDRLARWLGITQQESDFLYGFSGLGQGDVWDADALKGQAGVAEARRRLEVVADRYRHTPTPTPSLKQERDFINSVRAIADNDAGSECEIA